MMAKMLWTTVSSLGSERYSFKIEFDHYDSSKSYHGLDKLSLNNLIQDSTMMKDYLTYTMMNAFGVNSPLCSYVYITVNGEDWGLYLAVEGVEEAFLERNYGSDVYKRQPSAHTRRCCIRVSPIVQYPPLLPPVGVWAVSQSQCGRSTSQSGYRSSLWWAVTPPTG